MMPLSDRDYMRGKHPPACTCKACSERRLGKDKRARNIPSIPWRVVPEQHKLTPHKRERPKQPSVQYHQNHKQQRSYIKRESPRAVRILSTIILSLAIIFAIGLFGGGIYGVVKYHSNVWDWMSQQYHNLAGNVITITDDVLEFVDTSKDNILDSEIAKSITDIITNASTPTPEAVTPQTSDPTIPSQTTPILTIPIPEPKLELKNPSWAELKLFLSQDKADMILYNYPIFVCADFTDMLQHNAKEAGWRCATMSVGLSGYPDWFKYGIPSNTSHACNAFETTDRGLVYIDCTGTPSGLSGNADKIVKVAIGEGYIPRSIFPQHGWSSTWGNMGKVVSIGTLNW